MYSGAANDPTIAGQTNTPARDDEWLVAAATSGDAAAFEQLVGRYSRRVLARTRRMSGSSADAEDLAQQAFMKAYANLSKFEGRSSFSTWLVSIATNEALMWRRKARKSREVSIADNSGGEETTIVPEFPDSRPNPENCYSDKECSRLLLSAMERLEPGTRAAIQLCDLQEQSVSDTALQLGISESAVKSRRSRGRARLRRKLECCLAPRRPISSVEIANAEVDAAA